MKRKNRGKPPDKRVLPNEVYKFYTVIFQWAKKNEMNKMELWINNIKVQKDKNI